MQQGRRQPRRLREGGRGKGISREEKCTKLKKMDQTLTACCRARQLLLYVIVTTTQRSGRIIITVYRQGNRSTKKLSNTDHWWRSDALGTTTQHENNRARFRARAAREGNVTPAPQTTQLIPQETLRPTAGITYFYVLALCLVLFHTHKPT